MSAINDGGTAFPAPELGEQEVGQRGAYPGMSLRDYFAGQALNGILACFRDYRGVDNAAERAQMAYAHADAMIAAREKGGAA